MEPDALKNIQSLLSEKRAGISFVSSSSPTKNKAPYNIENGVAIINIQGVITPRADLFTLLFGGTSLETIQENIKIALEDKEVKSILLNVDSPGGVALGTSETAETIYKARQNQNLMGNCQLPTANFQLAKPIWSYVGRNCCSAAYWLASAGDKIIAHRSALLGSIGVVSTIPIQEQPDKDGYRNFEIVSSNAKNKRPDPRTSEGLAEIRQELDSIETEFITSISKYRGLPIDLIKSDFGQGGVMMGTKAIEVGMADELGTFEETIAKMAANDFKRLNSQKTNFSNDNFNNNTKVKTMNNNTNTISKDRISAKYLKEEFPEIIEAIQQESFDTGTQEGFEAGKVKGFEDGKKEGAKSERERLLAIDSTALAGYEDLVAEAKKDPTMTAEKLALKIVEAEKSKGNSYLASIKSAEAKLPQIDPSAAIETKDNTPSVDPNAPVEERAEAEWTTNATTRTEFNGDKEAFIAFYKANENGQIKLKNN